MGVPRSQLESSTTVFVICLGGISFSDASEEGVDDEKLYAEVYIDAPCLVKVIGNRWVDPSVSWYEGQDMFS